MVPLLILNLNFSSFLVISIEEYIYYTSSSPFLLFYDVSECNNVTERFERTNKFRSFLIRVCPCVRKEAHLKTPLTASVRYTA